MALKQLRRMALFVLGIGVGVLLASGEKDSSDLHARIFGYGSYEFGQIVTGQYTFARSGDGRLDHYFMEKAISQIGVNVTRDNGLSFFLAGEGMVYFPYAGGGDGSGFGYELLESRYKWYLHQAEGIYSFGGNDASWLKIGVGFFPFKYNPDGRNFGDYLFRMSTYPQYMPTTFDSPYQRLLGLHLSSILLNSFKQDFLVTSELYLWPLRDFSLTYITSYNLLNIVEVGGGVMLHRLFSVDNNLTTPSNADQNQHDFTFAGTKIMFRGALDIKPLVPFLNDYLGKNDCRLYSELCLNGIQNYEITDTTDSYYPGYNNIAKRIPILFGVNVPTLKVLDVFNFEVEWWDNNFANSYWGVYPKGYKQNPFPEKYDSHHKALPYSGPWHWSIYAEKNILKNVNLKAQVARDHTVIETTLTGISNADPQEAMDGLGSWAWMGKIEFVF